MEDLDFGNQINYAINEREYVGGYLDGHNEFGKNISPEIQFQSELKTAYNLLENFISKAEFDNIVQNLTVFNYYLYKNPTLILISFIVLKQSEKNQINPQKLKSVFNNHEVSPHIKQNNITQYDVLRYCRFMLKNYDIFISPSNY